MKSTIHQKVLASTVNCLIVMIPSLLIYLASGWEAMRISAVILFFLYNLIFRKRCVGMMVAGTYYQKPVSLFYITLYTIGFSTFFWKWQVQFDLLLANAVCQIFSVAMTGNTLHGYIAGQWSQVKA